MLNTTLEILPSPQEIPHDCKESQANRVTLLHHRFSRCQLEVSIETNGRLRGWVIAGKTREVKLNGLPAYLNFKKATQLLNQSYLKFQKEAITVLPKGLGGGMNYSRLSFVLGSNKEETCEEEALLLAKAIWNIEERKVVQKVVKELLKNDPEKKHLNLRHNQISTKGTQALGAALQVNQSLQSLSFSNNRLDVGGVQALGAVLQVNQSIQLLYLTNNDINAAGTQALGTALQVNQSLQSLYLDYNQIGAAGAQILGAALQVNQSLQLLNLKWNNIGVAGAQALGTALQVNRSLQSLDLAYNQIGAAGAQALGTALQVNQSIRLLDLGDNLIGDAGAQALGTALQVNRSLQSLDLAYNQIGAAGAQALGAALQVNQSIRLLDLGDNLIGDAGAQALGAALQVNQSIQKLNLSRNGIGDIGTQALGAALQVNQSIRLLNLCWNRIGDAGAQALGTALQVNQSLQELYLEENQIGAAGAQALGTALQVNQSLQSLYLEKNQIGTAGAQALGTALQVNQSLQELYLEENQISTAGAQVIGAALQVNHTLQWLRINEDPIDDEGIITKERIDTLLQGNKQIAILFQQQITQVQNFLQSHENNDGILLEHLPQLKKLLKKWHTDSKNTIPSLEEILRQSGRSNLNDRYREKLKGIITNLTNRLHNLWLESFERKVPALSNQYVMGKESSEKRNADLGYALYETWLTFLGSDCPNWVEDHIQSLIPFGVLLDIAEGEGKKDITDLTDAHSLFERVFAFRNESKDSLFGLTNQSPKS